MNANLGIVIIVMVPGESRGDSVGLRHAGGVRPHRQGGAGQEQEEAGEEALGGDD